MVLLRSPVHVRGENMLTVGEFILTAGETVAFVLTYAHSHLPLPPALAPASALAATEAFWTDWSVKARSAGPWSDAVCRSLITLKAGFG